ncbi:hypothetical protein K458DRAFT_87732 [Lentithecium fluviatile CBS 122367]|uniref:Protein Zds1 C-terminal domain-containing protein n=1 Tax=Lentithecium fluviatile CBS 122367 TaxID=1168545 RepID=A0A6G1IRQ8_9PLEO|nr:hypothetical protein K458DRAFT_87732 [Lentithecium fluviatile CBS 122367]
MQASERARELERVYQQRRGHAPQISISDDNHHVTEAIGDLYGHDDDFTAKRSSRPLSFIPNPLGDNLETALSPFDPFPTAPPKSPLRPQAPADTLPSPSTSANGNLAIPQRKSSTNRAAPNGPLSPPLTRTNSDTATQQFPLHDLEYESSPAGLAQELSNLQAIRRMSMDVNTSDPDLPSFKSFNASAVAPQHFSEEDDPSKLFWVPARLHPELAPKEFKTFIEEKVDKIRRRSGDSDSLSPDGALGRQSSGGGLRRKKSMLSRQIDSGSGYRDGAERLERKRSDGPKPNGGLPHLQELEHIVEDPAALVRRMSIDAARRHSATDSDGGMEDVPILPAKIAALGTLKRSTRTNYRRGSLRKQGPLSRRAAVARQAETDTEESPTASPIQEPDLSNLTLTRVQSEPVGAPENFSRPTRKRSPPAVQQFSSPPSDVSRPDSSGYAQDDRKTAPQAKPFHSRIASNGRTTAPLPGYIPPQQQQVPQIIETPPPPEPNRKLQVQLPERNSSRQPPPSNHQAPQGPRQPPQQQHQRPSSATRQNRHAQAAQASPIKPAQSFDELIANPSALPGSNTRTDNLSIIPTEDKKPDKKSKDKKDNEGSSRKTSWGWLRGSDDKEKERDKKEKEEREKELAKKVKNKLSKPQEKGHDDTRLDVLQTSITGGGRGRESVVLDRESVKLEEERKKESSRKSSGGDVKKEKETGLFSSIFGGGKKKGEKESSHKKGSSMRGLSPDPPPRILKPDIDYNWTRFSILEERAIYRMAHIKLANPRRELYSQVLLSNFMYSYLAKVQQMHPQIQIGTSAQAKQQQQRQAAQQKKDQPDEFTQYQSNSKSSQTRGTNLPPTVHKRTLAPTFLRKTSSSSKINSNTTKTHGRRNGTRAIHITRTMGTRMAGIVLRTARVIWEARGRTRRGPTDTMTRIRAAGMMICGNSFGTFAQDPYAPPPNFSLSEADWAFASLLSTYYFFVSYNLGISIVLTFVLPRLVALARSPVLAR